MNKLLSLDCTQDLTPKQLVQGGYCDATAVFVKGDPHKIAKIKEGRLRLIFSVSAIDNLIARKLCCLQNSTEIDCWSEIRHKSGMGLDDEGLSALHRNVEAGALGGTIAEADVKGWDWSIQGWELEADCERRIDLCSARGTVFERLIRAHFYCVARKVIVLSDGTMYQQVRPGIMPSGWYNTSSSNCFMRCLNHNLVVEMHNRFTSGKYPSQLTKAWCIAAGDDTVERFVPNAQFYYKSLGKTVDMYKEVTPRDFEFCSTRFIGDFGYPETVDRQLVNLFTFVPNTMEQYYERYYQFLFEFRHHPELSYLSELVAKYWGFDECA